LSDRELARRTVLPSLIFYGLLAAVSCAIAWWGQDRSPFVLRAEGRWPLALSVGAGAGIGLAVVTLSSWADRRWTWAREMSSGFRAVLGTPGPGESGVLALSSSLGEELLFRGVLLHWMGPVLSTVVFAGMHVAPGRISWHWTLFAGLLGAGFAWLSLASGDLVAAVVAHLTVNYFNLLALGQREEST
jgi:membrane protease YdiL (CAAX protease family)